MVLNQHLMSGAPLLKYSMHDTPVPTPLHRQLLIITIKRCLFGAFIAESSPNVLCISNFSGILMCIEIRQSSIILHPLSTVMMPHVISPKKISTYDPELKYRLQKEMLLHSAFNIAELLFMILMVFIPISFVILVWFIAAACL